MALGGFILDGGPCAMLGLKGLTDYNGWVAGWVNTVMVLTQYVGASGSELPELSFPIEGLCPLTFKGGEHLPSEMVLHCTRTHLFNTDFQVCFVTFLSFSIKGYTQPIQSTCLGVLFL